MFMDKEKNSPACTICNDHQAFLEHILMCVGLTRGISFRQIFYRLLTFLVFLILLILFSVVLKKKKKLLVTVIFI